MSVLISGSKNVKSNHQFTCLFLTDVYRESKKKRVPLFYFDRQWELLEIIRMFGIKSDFKVLSRLNPSVSTLIQADWQKMANIFGIEDITNWFVYRIISSKTKVCLFLFAEKHPLLYADYIKKAIPCVRLSISEITEKFEGYLSYTSYLAVCIRSK